jgi:hypothetical protein
MFGKVFDKQKIFIFASARVHKNRNMAFLSHNLALSQKNYDGNLSLRTAEQEK